MIVMMRTSQLEGDPRFSDDNILGMLTQFVKPKGIIFNSASV